MADDDQERILDEIRRRIVEAVSPQRIILFGSRARGEGRQDADYDLVVVAESDAAPWETNARIQKAHADLRIRKDIVLYTPSDFERYSGWLSSVARRAAEEGRVLYEAA